MVLSIEAPYQAKRRLDCKVALYETALRKALFSDACFPCADFSITGFRATGLGTRTRLKTNQLLASQSATNPRKIYRLIH